MTQLKSFKDLGVTSNTARLEGDKIKIHRIFDRQITIEGYRLVPSKFPGKGNEDRCLHLQIVIDDKKHVVFTGSGVLTDMILQIPKDAFPFTTTIVERQQTKHYEFT